MPCIEGDSFPGLIDDSDGSDKRQATQNISSKSMSIDWFQGDGKLMHEQFGMNRHSCIAKSENWNHPSAKIHTLGISATQRVLSQIDFTLSSVNIIFIGAGIFQHAEGYQNCR